MTKITEEIKKLLAEEKRMHREAITYIDKAPKGVLCKCQHTFVQKVENFFVQLPVLCFSLLSL